MTFTFIPRMMMALGAVATTLCLAPAASGAPPAPGDGPLVQTTCNYDQIVSALRVQAPDLASTLDQYPQAQAKLREFVAMPIDQRKQRLQHRLDANPQWRTALDEKRATPDGQQKEQALDQVAATCHNY